MPPDADGAPPPDGAAPSAGAAPVKTGRRPKFTRARMMARTKEQIAAADAAAAGGAAGAATEAKAAAPAVPDTSQEEVISSRCPEKCDNPDVQEVNGEITCLNCGAVVDDTNFVNDVDFAETSAGAAVVQGSYIAGDKRYATTLNGRSRRAGGGVPSLEVTKARGRDEIRKIAALLHIDDAIAERASAIYGLAADTNMIQGRRIRVIAACVLYLACRQQRNNGNPKFMLLIDFADAIKVNVYSLGKTYRDLRDSLYLSDDAPARPDGTLVPVPEIEDLVLKYARRLEFRGGEQVVANDAVRIIRRMKRDWIVTGRIPNGLIGACLILAARMNNYRRTVREVVYVVKAASLTVTRRLEEFNRTTSGSLSVDDFRAYSDRLKDTAVPPSVYMRDESGKRKRKRGDTVVIDDTPTPTPGPGSRVATEQPEDVRRDADGFAVPPAPASSGPIDPSLTGEPSTASPSPAESETPAPTQASTAASTAEPTAESSATPETGEEHPPKRRKLTRAATAASTAESTGDSPASPGGSGDRGSEDSISRKRSLPDEETSRRLASKKRRKATRQRYVLTNEDLEEERELETEIQTILHDPEAIANMEEAKLNEYADRAKRLAAARREMERQGRPMKRPYSATDKEKDAALLAGTVSPAAETTDNANPEHPNDSDLEDEFSDGETAETAVAAAASAGGRDTAALATLARATPSAPAQPAAPARPGMKRRRSYSEIDLDSVEIAEDEFDDDPDVLASIMTEEQSRRKERIWCFHNSDWLREQQRKSIKQMLDENSRAGQPDRPRKKAKRSRIGDGSLLAGREPPKDSAEAARIMLDKRAPKGWTKYIDMDKFKSAMAGSARSASSRASSRASSVAPSPAASGPESAGEGGVTPADAASKGSEAARSAGEGGDAAADAAGAQRAKKTGPGPKPKTAAARAADATRGELAKLGVDPDEFLEDEDEENAGAGEGYVRDVDADEEDEYPYDEEEDTFEEL